MGLGIGGSLFWNPLTIGYGDQGLAPVGKQILEQTPETGWYRFQRSLGVADDNSAFSRWFKNQFPQFQLGYNAYTVENPLTANITDYTASLGGIDNFMRQFNLQDPRLRGLSPGDRGGGPARWISR